VLQNLPRISVDIIAVSEWELSTFFYCRVWKTFLLAQVRIIIKGA
jgi:hypothetical protein